MQIANSSDRTTEVLASTMGIGTIQRFTGNKISKVRFLHDQSESASRFVTGTWASSGRGNITFWNVSQQSVTAQDGEGIEQSSRIELGKADVTDICVVNARQFVVSTTAGEVRIVDCPVELSHNDGRIEKSNKMSTMSTFSRIHRYSTPTAVCVLNNEIYSGSDSGQIVCIQTQCSSSNAVKLFAQDLMGVTSLTPYGPFHLISAHTTGQIHLWDVRKRQRSAEFGGIQPEISRSVTSLNNSITALSTHPAQYNVIAFGSQDGVVSFIDIRQPNQLLPIAFKVSQDPINQIKFHPIFANNCYSSSDSGLIHWDASAFAREMNFQSDPLVQQCSMMEQESDGDTEHRNIWLYAHASTNVNLRILIEEDPRMLSSFDVVQNAFVVGSHSGELVYLHNANFAN